jgi:acetate kinase
VASASVLALNAGSSTIKFGVFRASAAPERSLSGTIDRTGASGATLAWRTPDDRGRLDVPQGSDAASFLFDWLAERTEAASLRAVGHRIVHGLRRTEPAPITPDILTELHRASPYAPEHLPSELALISVVADRRPHLPQVACFDTAFHRDMPAVARQLPLPRRYQAQGLQRYGFHGLSYAYLLEELRRLAGPDAADGRIIFAHLGHGASLAAVRHGRPIDTSMGFTPAAGLVMGTRTGDLDPGLVAFLARTEGLTADGFDALVNHASGLLGISETSGDMRDLLAREPADPRAAEAIALFCYQATKWMGAFAAALGGLDTLVFSAGIGERSPEIRARVCRGLGFLGLDLDEARNDANAPVISAPASRVTARVIATDEELMIARLVCRTLGLGSSRKDGSS